MCCYNSQHEWLWPVFWLQRANIFAGRRGFVERYVKTRRFIAGAVCPRCSAMDKIVIDGETDQRECVACGFSDARPKGPAEELPTRVSRASARRVETAAEVVTLLDPAAAERDS